MALVHDEMAVVGHPIRNFAAPDHALDKRDVDDACRFAAPAANDANMLRVNCEEGFQTFDPLGEQFSAVHEDQRVAGALRDQCRGDDRLTERRGGS